MSFHPLPPQPLACIERQLMRWPNSPRLLRLAEEARKREGRAEVRFRARLLREARAILSRASTSALKQLVLSLRLQAEEAQP